MQKAEIVYFIFTSTKQKLNKENMSLKILLSTFYHRQFKNVEIVHTTLD